MFELVQGWEIASSPPGACAGVEDVAELRWRAARVPGTAAGAVANEQRDFDAEDWWFRTRFDVAPSELGEQIALELDGVATVSEVFLNGALILESSSMWESHTVDVSDRLAERNELLIACRALRPRLAERRRPRARWRTRVVSDGNLRWYRTMLFGRSPGFAPGPAPVGPWRPVRIVGDAEARLGALALRPRLQDGAGLLSIKAQLAGAHGVRQGGGAVLELRVGESSTELSVGADGKIEAELRVPGAGRWWPHTHGDPELHEFTASLDGVVLARRQVGFRTLEWLGDPERDGLDLIVNDVPLFVRGAVWTPADLRTMAPSPQTLRELLTRVRAAGMNMLRVVGTGAYESPLFYDLCDELGILVWQDFMFANLDYPTDDPAFRARVERELQQVLGRIAGRPSLAVLCGNSEVEQQPAMMGLDPKLGRSELWEQVIPGLVRESGADAVYVRSTPVGGDQPFHANRGIAHYFGVSGYFRPTDDARRAEVRFAAECLAFANVPDEVGVPVHHPRWKEGVQRDAGTGWDQGAGWDFDDVRDHYLRLLHAVDPVQLRRSDHERYLELSRAVSGEVMAEVMGEWRREGSPCRGALVLWLKDMLPGAGLGVLDHTGQPKLAYHHLRRALAPVAVWTTDEGVNGVAIHVANDRPEPLAARLRVALYRDFETQMDETAQEIEVPAHASILRTVEGMLGRFLDAAWAYRFGPPAQDAIFVSLESAGQVVSQSVRFPAGLPAARETATQLGLSAALGPDQGGIRALTISSRRVAYGVRLHTPGFLAEDDGFTVEPGVARIVQLHATAVDPDRGGSLSALNLEGTIKLTSST